MRKLLIATTAVLLLLTGCSFQRNIRRSSNLMNYLYPVGEGTPREATDVALQLPLRLGITFVPADSSSNRWIGGPGVAPADIERDLLEIVKKSFTGREWVREIVVIPSGYLTPGGGFQNLDQISKMFNVDVIALASVDQIQSSNPRRMSFLYLTIVGAYVLPLDKNDTRTLIDVAVFHVPSRTFLLRAPGQSHITGSSTAMDVYPTLADKSKRGLTLAMQDVSKNLDDEVKRFKASIASGERRDVDIITTKGESVRKSGSFSWLEAAAALLLAGVLLLARRT
jgi:rhombotail lipoprotein